MVTEEEFRTDYITREFGDLVGKTVKAVRPMSPAECHKFYWDYAHQVAWLIEFTDGTVAVPSCDPEGNGRGHLIIL